MSIQNRLVYTLVWGLFLFWSIVGINRISDYIIGGIYSNTDGDWALWSAESILRFGRVLDLSPFNIFSGMGSMFLPNLPWLNPAALSLGLPFESHTVQVISYVVYGAELAISIIVLARAIGCSTLQAHLAAQVHLILLFPPFSAVFQPVEWYSAAPVYAHLTSILNIAFVLFMRCGEPASLLRNISLSVGLLLLITVGVLSAPFSFVFFIPPYASAALALGWWRSGANSEFFWKISTVVVTALLLLAAGTADYYAGTVAAVARTPSSHVDWATILSIDGWIRMLNMSNICNDPRTLLCRGNPLLLFQVLALLGAFICVVLKKDRIRHIAISFICYVAFVHIYAIPYQLKLIGPMGALSVHFLMWSSYTFSAVFAVIAVTAFVSSLLQSPSTGPIRTLIERIGPGLADMRAPVSRRSTAAAMHAIALLILPLAATYLWHRDRIPSQPKPEPLQVGPIVQYLVAQTSIDLGQSFRGYTALHLTDPTKEIIAMARGAHTVEPLVSVYGRSFLRSKFGNSFTEMDLWRFNIPTFDEYGQWISRQSQIFVRHFLLPPEMFNVFLHPNFLRVFALDVEILKVLGVRFLITDERMEDARLSLRLTQQGIGRRRLYLYEIAGANLVTYSPTQIVQATTLSQTVDAIRENRGDFDRIVVVTHPIQKSFVPVRDAKMSLIQDGVHVSAVSDGHSVLLLPIQYSNCLRVSHVNGGDDSADVRLHRANLLQTLVEFNKRLEIHIKFEFGLFGNGACRIRDGAELDLLSVPLATQMRPNDQG